MSGKCLDDPGSTPTRHPLELYTCNGGANQAMEAPLTIWDGLIVVCAVAAYDGIRMSDWHLAQHLSKLAPVLYVDPPSFRRPARAGPAAGGPAAAAGGPGPGPARPPGAAVPGPPRRGRDDGRADPA